MRFTGKFLNVARDWISGKYAISFTIDDESVLPEIDKIKDLEKLDIEAKKFRKGRSLDANALLWACLGEMANVLKADKWDVYLMMLRRYGKYTYICVKPNVVESVKRQWRECEVIGTTVINGKKATQMLCYFGSSTYDTKEFSDLLEGVISEMKDMGLQPPPSEDMRRALEQWEKQHGYNTAE